MKFIEGRGLYFTIFLCTYKGLVQAGWLLGKVFTHYIILMNIWCFMSLALLEALANTSKLAATTVQNRPKGYGGNHLRFKTSCHSNMSTIYFKLMGHYKHI